MTIVIPSVWDALFFFGIGFTFGAVFASFAFWAATENRP